MRPPSATLATLRPLAAVPLAPTLADTRSTGRCGEFEPAWSLGRFELRGAAERTARKSRRRRRRQAPRPPPERGQRKPEREGAHRRASGPPLAFRAGVRIS